MASNDEQLYDLYDEHRDPVWEAEQQAKRLREELRSIEEQRKQEAQWAREFPKHWAEWVRIQSKLGPNHDFDRLCRGEEAYGFEHFLKEVGEPPKNCEAKIERKDPEGPYIEGNLHWVIAGTNAKSESLPSSPRWCEEVLSRLDRIERGQVLAVTKEAYTTEEAAERLGRSEWTVRQWCNKGQVQGAYKVRGKGRQGEWRLTHKSITLLQTKGPSPVGTHRQP